MRRLSTLLMVFALTPWMWEDASGLRAVFSYPPHEGLVSEPLAIVVNRSNSVDNLSTIELRRVFLGYRSHWTDGRRITLVMREPAAPEERAVLREVCAMNEDQLTKHFIHGLFTGEMLVSPKTLDTPNGVRRFIVNVPGAIGFLRASDVDASVKVVRIDELLPDDKGYRLRVLSPTVN